MKKAYQVLFLEDEPTIREVLTEYMTLSGYEVTGLERGEEAIEALKTKQFDIAILDIINAQNNVINVYASIDIFILLATNPIIAIKILPSINDQCIA